jgi:PAS domain S-box-containing protein
MNSAELSARYGELQRYVGWGQAEADLVAASARFLMPVIPALIEDFYAEIQRHPAAFAVISGGQAQVERLKGTLRNWITELLTGPYDEAYVQRRARVGWRHVEIGLAQVYTNLALARLRSAMVATLCQAWRGSHDELSRTVIALNKLLDLDLAVITAMYEAEHVQREQAAVRLKLEGLLHQQREFSEGLLSHAQSIVLLLDLQGRIVRLNPYVERITGLSSAEAEGRDWLPLLIPPDDQCRARRELYEKVLREPTQPGLVSTALRVDDHPTRSVRWSSTLLRDPSGRPFALLLIGQDITDIEAAQERALRAERLAAIGQVAAGLAHEARNALQRIQASAEMLELEIAGQDGALDYVRRIEQAQAHLHQLFDEVRGYAATIQLDRSRCRLAAIWREAWELLATARRGRTAILCDAESVDSWEVEVDRFRLVQVFRNVFENSLAACADPVQIEVRCSPAIVGGRRAVRVSLLDNGPGLSGDQRRRIFEPFYTTKPKGTGLGMAIAQRLIEAHGGTIEVGNPTCGAEIIITLPVEGG